MCDPQKIYEQSQSVHDIPSMYTPSFSVVIPLYNKKDSIRTSIGSVLEQTFSAFELIVVNDGSTDGSAEWVSEIHDPRLRLLHQPNAGVSAARNRGIQEARNRFIAFLDADDFWEPEYLQEMADFIRSFPDAGMYGCAYDKVDNDAKRPVNFYLPGGYKGILQNYFKHARKNHLFWSSAVVIRKDILDRVGFFDERMSIGEDLDLWFRIALDHKVAFYNKLLAHYNTGAENRAILKKHDFSRNMLCYTAKYIQREQENKDFADFINLFRIRRLPELFLHSGLTRQEIPQYLKLIDTKGQGFYSKVLLNLPFGMQMRVILFNRSFTRIKRKLKGWKLLCCQ